MINLGPRIILDPYRGINCWTPHYPLLGVVYSSFRNKELFRSPWEDEYTLGVF